MPSVELRRQVRPSVATIGLLLRTRAWQLRNALDQQLTEAPWRSLAVVALLLIIWGALYLLLDLMLRQMRGWDLVGIVAYEHLFVHFFLVLAVMLAFSNAILTFTTLYGREEAAHLLAMPLAARQVVLVKWLESLGFSSWSFLLLGVPLMLAIAHNAETSWYYYPLFLGHFVGFVTIPACLGLLAACATALWFPRRPLLLASVVAAVLVGLTLYVLASLSQHAVASQQWLRQLFTRVSIFENPFLPSTWTARGVVAAMRRDTGESLFYLLVVAGNALGLIWLTVNVLARTWPEAYSRAQQGRVRQRIRYGLWTDLICDLLFVYLPLRLRRIMLKDIRGFARDPRQWSQMAIMFGLLAVYVLNLRRLPIDVGNPVMKGLIVFLNLTTISLILATFTSRFIYPLLSLESQQLWLLEHLPVRRTTLLLTKFLFALTITVLSGGVVMLLAVVVLELPPVWARVNLIICLAVCLGLSGLSVGLGARFPVLGQRNPARIASGFGGTINLLASMIFVGIEMAGVAWLALREFGQRFGMPSDLTRRGELLVAALVAFSAIVAAGALAVGARHFERLEA